MRPRSLGRTTVRLACVVIGFVIVLTIAELTSARFKEFTGTHSLISTFMTEAILLVGVYLVIDEIIERREARRWSDLSSLGLRALSVFARGPAEIIRRSFDELAVETARAQPGSENYEQLNALIVKTLKMEAGDTVELTYERGGASHTTELRLSAG